MIDSVHAKTRVIQKEGIAEAKMYKKITIFLLMLINNLTF